MKLVCALVVVACMTGCGGTLVLQSRSDAPDPRHVPAPMPAPTRVCVDIGRDEAVQIVATEAGRQRVVRMRVDEVKRHKNEWRVDMTGTDSCGQRVDIRARVDRRSGALKAYAVQSRRHGQDVEGDDDDGDHHHHDD